MNAITPVTASTDVAVYVSDPVAVLTNEAQAQAMFSHIEKEIAAFEPDLSTDKGRKAIASLAYKVSRTKTAIDSAGEKLIEEARKTVDAVNKERKRCRDRLDGLRDLARAPLTEWEEAEDARKNAVQAAIADFTNAVALVGQTPAEIKAVIDRVEGIPLDPEVFREDMERALSAKGVALTNLNRAHAQAEQAERDRAELERLRKEQEERDRAEVERLAREADERRQREAAEAAKKAEEERAAAAARAEEERKASEERRVREAEERARAEEKRKADEEIARLKAAEEQRLAEERRLAADAARREADRAHRGNLMGEAKASLIACGADEETAKKIVLAIIANEIPHVSFRF